MIDLHYWPTPNGHKITMMLEECGFDYRIVPVDITKGAQLAPGHLKISPNNKMPAIVDHDPGDGGGPLSVFESGAILLYLARKAHRFAGDTLRQRVAVKEWLLWASSGLGPMAGQAGHFIRFAPEPVPYAVKRYTDETLRLLGVLDKRLAAVPFLAGADYGIADIASFSWAKGIAPLVGATGLTSIDRWVAAIEARPATARAYARAAEVQPPAATAA